MAAADPAADATGGRIGDPDVRGEAGGTARGALPPSEATDRVTPERIERARRAIEGVVRPTPLLSSRTLSERAGGTVLLKAESLQRTGSFKLRGALARLAALGDGAADGVVAGSAGNHAQAVAYAARARGVACTVHMPTEAPIGKVEACRALGADVRLGYASVDEAVAAAAAQAAEEGLATLHPYDDPDVVAGQATLGLELLEEVPDLARVVVPLGGGGLCSGVALAVRRARPEVRVVGVQAEALAAFPRSLRAGEPLEPEPGRAGPTIADGIAVKRPGGLTLPLVRELLDEVVTVGEDDIADAMVFLLERARLVVEGAGAVGVAAVAGGAVAIPTDGTTVVVLSGGNVDSGLLLQLARRHETQAGRRSTLFTVVPDRPAALAGLLEVVAAAGANVVEVEHLREGIALDVRETGVQLVLETRGREHATRVRRAVQEAGYAERILL